MKYYLSPTLVFIVIAVIDFCLARILVFDQETNYQSLCLTWASKSNCIQRRGIAHIIIIMSICLFLCYSIKVSSSQVGQVEFQKATVIVLLPRRSGILKCKITWSQKC